MCLGGQGDRMSLGPEVIIYYSVFNSAEHKIFSANKYENVNKS